MNKFSLKQLADAKMITPELIQEVYSLNDGASEFWARILNECIERDKKLAEESNYNCIFNKLPVEQQELLKAANEYSHAIALWRESNNDPTTFDSAHKIVNYTMLDNAVSCAKLKMIGKAIEAFPQVAND